MAYGVSMHPRRSWKENMEVTACVTLYGPHKEAMYGLTYMRIGMSCWIAVPVKPSKCVIASAGVGDMWDMPPH